jgi:hypothetical protein
MINRDMKALAKYFTRPADEGKRHVSGGTKQGGKDTSEKTTPPPPVRKPFRIVTGADRIHIVPNGSAAPQQNDLPISCELELAYEGLDQDPFKAYDPFDFNLADAGLHAITLQGATVTACEGNRLSFDVIDPVFFVEVPGFDTNIRLRAKLNYTEKSHGTSVSEE